MRRALWMGMRRSLRSTKTNNLTTATCPPAAAIMMRNAIEPQASVCTFADQVAHAARQSGHDAGKDQQTHAVADAAIGNLLAQPHDEGGACRKR